MKEGLILIGGGGHCKSCIDVIEAENKFKIAGIVDKKEKIHQRVLDYEIIACDEDLPKLIKEYRYFLIAFGEIRNSDKRIKKFEDIKRLGGQFPVIISPLAYISKSAFIYEGTIIMHRAFINADAVIGKNCIINTGVIIEHDVKIGEGCHVSTSSVINGECQIGRGTFVGSNSVIANNVKIAKNTIIGGGSVVVKSINKSGIYAGVPAQSLYKNG